MDASWGSLRGPFDHIFCRNVTIYFDRPTQARLYPRLAALLAGDGSFYAGHSENLTWLPELFHPEGLTVYSLTGGQATHAPARKGPPPLPTMAAPTPLPPARTPLPPVRTPLVSVTPARASTSLKRPWTAEIAEQALQAGDVLVSVEPKILRTTLGSCVSVCMYDPVAKIGGMNHFMLPGAGDALETSTRFGLQAMEMLINKLLKIGAEKHRLIAKIAGACKVLDVSPAAGSVSDRNLAFVDEFLSTEGFEVKGRRVGGTSALEVRFRTDTGEAFVRAVDSRWTQQVVIEDRAYAKRLVVPLPKPDDDGITWFR
jgi:chemotaxis receptor (MCP) glutamine deamidase CheD